MFRASSSLSIPLVVGAALVIACGQSDPAGNQSGEYSHVEWRGDCLGDIVAVQDSGYLETEVIGNDLHIRHEHAYYNCCLDYEIDYSIWENAITAAETDSGPPCRCDCLFDLESTLYDFSVRTYCVTIVGISGEFVGVDTVSVL